MKKIFLLLSILLLSSCFNSSDDNASVVTFHNPMGKSSANSGSTLKANFVTSEYYSGNFAHQNFLEQVKAAEAYSYLQSISKEPAGKGITVTVFDSGVDSTHSELSSRYNSADSHTLGGSDSEGHGTFVAGVIAAAKDGVGMHGVAYDATITSVPTNSFSTRNSITTRISVSNFSSAIINTKATIINNSWALAGGDNDDRLTIQSSITSIANNNNKNVLVFAAGNDGFINSSFPAIDADNSAYGGQVISVGALNANNTETSYSNRCGAVRRCLFAPGGDANLGHQIYSLKTGGGYDTSQGTSFSAPIVSGAAAMLQAAWSNLTGEEVINILLNTATDLGATGWDEIYGYGLLNLYQAVLPEGEGSSILTPTSQKYNTAQTKLTIPQNLQAMSNNPELKNLLAQGVFFDQYNRDYSIDYNEKITSYGDSSDNFVNQFDQQNSLSPLNFNLNNMNIDSYNQKKIINKRLANFYAPQEDDNTILLDNISLRFNLRNNDNNQFGFSRSSYLPAIQNSSFFSENLNGVELKTKNNFLSFYEQNGDFEFYNFDYKYSFKKKFILQSHFIYAESNNNKASLNGFISRINIKQKYFDISSSLNLYQEKNAFAGITGDGAFDLANSSKNNGVNISFFSKFRKKFNFLLSANFSEIKPNYKSDFFTGDKKFRTSTYLASAVFDADKNNKFAFIYSKPWLVNQGEINLTIPVGIDSNNIILTKTANINFEDFDQDNFEFLWQRKINKKFNFKFNSVYKKYYFKDSNYQNIIELYANISKSF